MKNIFTSFLLTAFAGRKQESSLSKSSIKKRSLIKPGMTGRKKSLIKPGMVESSRFMGKEKHPLLLLLFTIVVVAFSYRHIFFSSFDHEYLKDFYDHSQWTIANSPRVMGDGELYRYVGYELVDGRDPSLINPEVPPLGKYIYGLASHLYRNPLLINPILYLLSILFFTKTAQILTKSTKKSLLLAIIFAANPIIASQIGDTGLDLMQITFLLGYLYFLIRSQDKNGKHPTLMLLTTGAFLGLFSAVKTPLLSPLLVIHAGWIFKKKKRFSQVLWIIIPAGLIYTISFSRYFQMDHSFIDWIKTQWWMIMFYIRSGARRIPISVITTLISGFIFHSQKGLMFVKEWSPIWLVGSTVLIQNMWKKPSKSTTLSINILYLSFLGFYIFTPFSKRYIITLLPFIIWSLKELSISKIHILALFQLTHLIIYIPISRQSDISEFISRMSSFRYADAYEYVSEDFASSINRRDFQRQLMKIDNSLETSQYEVELDKYPSIFSNNQTVSLTSTRKTPIGQIDLSTPFQFIKEHGRWKVNFDWKIILPEASAQSVVKMEIEEEMGGDLIASDNRILSSSQKRPFLFLTQKHATNSALLFSQLNTITYKDPLTLGIMSHVQNNFDATIPIGFTKHNIDDDILQQVTLSPAISVEMREDRVYPEGLLDKKFEYLKIIRSLESSNFQIRPQSGGRITIEKSERIFLTIYESQPISGEDVVLEKSINEILGEDAVLML